MSEITLRLTLTQANMLNAALAIAQQHLQMLSAELQGQVMLQIQPAPSPASEGVPIDRAA